MAGEMRPQYTTSDRESALYGLRGAGWEPAMSFIEEVPYLRVVRGLGLPTVPPSVVRQQIDEGAPDLFSQTEIVVVSPEDDHAHQRTTVECLGLPVEQLNRIVGILVAEGTKAGTPLTVPHYVVHKTFDQAVERVRSTTPRSAWKLAGGVAFAGAVMALRRRK